jgi:hypothetical protein
MDDTDKMCVYEGYNKARDCRVETLVKHEAHRYLSTSEWINAADILAFRIHFILYVYILWNHNFYFLFYILIQLYHRTEYKLNLCSHFQFKTNKVQTHKSETENKGFVFFEGHVET